MNLNVGIIGAGKIARKMADTVNLLDGFTNYAVASRDLRKALDFQNDFGFVTAYGSYEELLADEKVDLVYIATVHSAHYGIMERCLYYGKPVLCEKCLTTSLSDTTDIFKRFEEKNLLVSEALWTSFLPSRKIVSDLLNEGLIGEIQSMYAEFKVPISNLERIRKVDLGGGAMMDMGVYPVSFVFRTLGFDYAGCEISDMVRNEYGADLKEKITFRYESGVEATCVVDCTAERSSCVRIVGKKGRILLDSVTCPKRIEIYGESDQLTRSIDCSPALGGFEFELLACKDAIANKQSECPAWTHQNSVEVSKIIEKVIRFAE